MKVKLLLVPGMIIFGLLSSGCGDARHFSKGQKLMTAKMYPEAVKEFEIIVNEYPDSRYAKDAKNNYNACRNQITAQRMLEEAQNLDRQGSIDAARKRFDETLLFMIQNNLGNTDAIRARIEELQANKVKDYEQRGDRFMAANAYADAIREFDAAWEYSNQNPTSELASKRKTARRMIVLLALEAKIREAEEAALLAKRGDKKPAAPAMAKKSTIDIIRGPGSGGKGQAKGKDSEQVDLDHMRELWKKMQSDSTSKTDDREIQQLAEQWNLMAPGR